MGSRHKRKSFLTINYYHYPNTNEPPQTCFLDYIEHWSHSRIFHNFPATSNWLDNSYFQNFQVESTTNWLGNYCVLIYFNCKIIT